MFEIFVPFGRWPCCLLPPFVNSYHVCIQIHATCCCFPRCTTETFGVQKSALWGCKVGEGDPGACQAGQKPRATSSQQPACTHKEHQILTTAEATAFAAQFWDRTHHPSKLQDWQKLKKYVPNNKHGDVCPNGVPALPEKDNANDDWE